jgi:hypothetical protein
MRNAAFGARQMRQEIRLPFRRRTDRLHPKHPDAAIRQPVHRFQRQTRKIMQIPGRVQQPFIRRHVQQHRIPRANLLP